MRIIGFLAALLTSLALGIWGLFEKFSYSRPVPDLKKWKLKDKIYLVMKILRPVLKAEKGRGIEEFFAGQDLEFKVPAGFAETSRMSICAGGDIMHCPGFSPESLASVFDETGPFLFSGDIIYANLETPVDPNKPPVPIIRGDRIMDWLDRRAPILNGSTETIDAFSNSGGRLDIISTASNHCINMGMESLVNTLDMLDGKGIVHVGTSRTIEEQDDIPVLERKGIRAAFLSYTFSVNEDTVEKGREYMVNLVALNEPGADLSLVKRHIGIAKTKGADLIVACLHWGNDMEVYPVQNIIDRAHELCDAGIDIIIGHHPHALQPMEKYISSPDATGFERTCLVAYSLSEILSHLFFLPISWLSAALRVEVRKGMLDGRQTALISDVKYLPFFKVCKKGPDGMEHFHQLDIKKAMSNLEEYTKRYSLNDMEVSVMGKLDKILDERILPAERKSLLR